MCWSENEGSHQLVTVFVMQHSSFHPHFCFMAASRLQAFSAYQPACNVITLKVKSEDGSHTYIVKMSPSETVGDLRRYLDKHRWGHISMHWPHRCFYSHVTQPAVCLSLHYRRSDVSSYDIISAYPQCNYDDDGQTLQSHGIMRNATLLLRQRKPGPSLADVNKALKD